METLLSRRPVDVAIGLWYATAVIDVITSLSDVVDVGAIKVNI